MKANLTVTNSLKFPCLLAIGSGSLLPLTKKQFKTWMSNEARGGDHFLFNYASSPRLQAKWLIDREGSLRTIKIINVKRSFLKKLSWFHDFTVAECEIDAGIFLEAGKLLLRIDSIKSPPGFPVGGHLKGYLRKQPPDKVFDSIMFNEFWEQFCREIDADDWSK